MQSRWGGWECPATADGHSRGQEQAPLSLAPPKMGGETGSTQRPARACHMRAAGSPKPSTRRSQRWTLTTGVSTGVCAPARQLWTRLTPPVPFFWRSGHRDTPWTPLCLPRLLSHTPNTSARTSPSLHAPLSPLLEFPKSLRDTPARGPLYVFQNCGNTLPPLPMSWQAWGRGS